MKRALIIGGFGLALLTMLCVGLVALALVVAPLRAEIGKALERAGERVRDRVAEASNPRSEIRISPQEVQAQADDEAGVLVAQVVKDSPAAEAGLRRADIILEVDGEPVNSVRELRNQLTEHQAGDQVELLVQRGDEQLTLTAVLAEQENGGQGRRAADIYLGVIGCDMPAAQGWGGMPDDFNMPFPMHTGLIIIQVAEDSPAAQAGLQRGERILTVDGVTMEQRESLAEVFAEHEPGDTVVLEIVGRSGETREVTVELGEHPEQAGQPYLGIRYRVAPMRMGPGDEMPFSIPDGELPPNHPEIPGLPFPDGDLEDGALIKEIIEGSPADRAGLEVGQLLLAFEGAEPVTAERLADLIAEHQPGDVVTLTVMDLPSGETRAVEVTLGEHPERAGAAWLGARFSFINIEMSPEQFPEG